MPIVKDFPQTNFVAIRNEVMQDQSLSYEARGVLGYLLSKSENWEPSIQDVANHGGMGRNKVRRIFAELEAAGYVKKSQPHTMGRYGTNVYTVYGQPRIGANRRPKVVAQKQCTENSEADINHSTDSIQCNGNSITVGATTKERVTKERSTKDIRSSDDDQTFDQFWSMWPKKVGKTPARKAWQKVKDKPAVLEHVRANLEMHASAGDWPDMKFVPNPATYINQERWSDTVYENRQSSNNSNRYRSIDDTLNNPYFQ